MSFHSYCDEDGARVVPNPVCSSSFVVSIQVITLATLSTIFSFIYFELKIFGQPGFYYNFDFVLNFKRKSRILLVKHVQ
jgi:hypothetical protein